MKPEYKELYEKFGLSNRGSFSRKKFTGIFIVSCLQGMKLHKIEMSKEGLLPGQTVSHRLPRCLCQGQEGGGASLFLSLLLRLQVEVLKFGKGDVELDL